MTSFNKIANEKRHLGYAEGDEIEVFQHTTGQKVSKHLVSGYMNFLSKIINNKFDKDNNCIDIGCGAGYIANEFKNQSLNIKALEYSDDAIAAVKKYNPALNIIQGDMTIFKELSSYDFIFSREVYLITRVNSFTDQYNIISNMIDNLKPGGVFMLVASDVSYPHCMDYDLIIETFKKDYRLSYVSDKYYEIIFNKFSKFIFGKISYNIINLFLRPLIWYKKKYQNWASIYIIGFVKK